jgi:hypothetical protein
MIFILTRQMILLLANTIPKVLMILKNNVLYVWENMYLKIVFAGQRMILAPMCITALVFWNGCWNTMTVHSAERNM